MASETLESSDERIGFRARPWTYEVGAEKVREYAEAIGEDSPIYYDRHAAREAGYREIVAPPMFVVVYSKWMAPLILDPALGIDYPRMLHGAQEFHWADLAYVNDRITTNASVTNVYEKGKLTFYETESTSCDQSGREIVRGLWTLIVRGE